jgi:ABC-2 type transport system ATP-binding protein
LLSGSAPVAELVGVVVNRGRRAVVRIEELTVPAGITAVLGPNGAGKSTLLRAIALVDTPATEGELRVLGMPSGIRASRRPLLRVTGFAAQAVSFFPGFTVRDTVEYAAWLKGVPASGRSAACRLALDAVGLAEVASKPTRRLSGGMLRRLAVAEAVVHRPALLILDEPTAGLDPVQRALLHRSVRTLGQRSSVLFSSHLTGDVAAMADHVVVLDGGRVTFAGTIDTFRALAAHEGAADLDASYAVAVEAGHAR